MILSDISTVISWLNNHPQVLKGINRGIERESLRINTDGTLAQTSHPKSLGSALTHKWITTDFAESLMEFITPINNDIDHIMIILNDIHRYTIRNIGNEFLWPMSMPCFIGTPNNIKIAQYGNSNIGKLKTVYRKGLKNRYTSLIQIIAGVHYNFSLPLSFWQSYTGIKDKQSGKEIISTKYLQLIRNYYRFGWVISYLFGASPGICSSFLKNFTTDLQLKKEPSGLMYLPYATSLRLSDLGYTNKIHNKLNLNFNCLNEYIKNIKLAIKTPSINYESIGIKKNNSYLQLNANILQNESELYTLIRPKCAMKNEESQYKSLSKVGIEYVEIRSLDVNPFSQIGISKEQIYFLDLFLIWCLLLDSPEMNKEELIFNLKNWNTVSLEGRKPGLMINTYHNSNKQLLTNFGKLLFNDIRKIAKIIDSNNGNSQYQQVCDKLVLWFYYPELTISARFLKLLIKYGIHKLGISLSKKYSKILCSEPLQILNEEELKNECKNSWKRQFFLEKTDKLNFDEFLTNKNKD